MEVILPKVEYMLPVWYILIHQTSSAHWQSGSVRHMREISKAQCLTCKLITGAFHSMATDVLELHTNIPPAQIKLANSCHREALRLCTLPKQHPLHTLVKHAARLFPKHHHSPLHLLLHVFKLCPASIETIDTTRQHPNWAPLVSTHIACDKKEVASHLHTWMDDILIYSDGAVYKDHAGAAVTAWPCSTVAGHHLQVQLGKLKTHTVFKSELTGILLAIHIICNKAQQSTTWIKTALVTLDNQVVIMALTNNV